MGDGYQNQSHRAELRSSEIDMSKSHAHRKSRRKLSRRRPFRIEPLEPRCLLASDGPTADDLIAVDDFFEVHQNTAATPIDVLVNDRFSVAYSGNKRITSVSFGSEGGSAEIAADGGSIVYSPPVDFAGSETFVYYVDHKAFATVTIAIRSPLRPDEYQFVPQHDARQLDLLSNDPFWEGYAGPRRITVVSASTKGSDIVIADDGQSVMYTHADRIGDGWQNDFFTYIVDDRYQAIVEVGVVNPLRRDGFSLLVKDTADNELDVLRNDSTDIGPRTITAVSETQHGGKWHH